MSYVVGEGKASGVVIAEVSLGAWEMHWIPNQSKTGQCDKLHGTEDKTW